jgi:hypothetical protein
VREGAKHTAINVRTLWRWVLSDQEGRSSSVEDRNLVENVSNVSEEGFDRG